MNWRQAAMLAHFYARNAVLMKGLGALNGRWNRRLWADGAARWAALHQAIAGHERWLVVGNGPSLRVADLEALSAIPAIASNRINLLFGQTTWRPRLLTVADPLLLHKLPAAHFADIPEVLVPHTHLFMARTRRKLAWRHISDAEGYRRHGAGHAPVSPMTGLFVGRTITVINLQLAIWAGAKTIYLIGCDHNYGREQALGGTGRVAHRGGSDHFHPDYRRAGELVNAAPIDLMDAAFAMVARIAEAHGVEIVNITRTSALDAFPRGTVEDAVRAIAARC